MTVGTLTWAYTLLLPTFWDSAILDAGPWGIEALRPQHLFGLNLPPLVHGVLWSLSLNLLTYVGFSLRRAPSPIERMQADVFVPTLAPMAPSFRLWRSSVTVEELISTVARYLGEERTRASFESFAATRRISLQPDAEADFELLRYAEHQLASAIGAASSRLVLSLLLRKRTVSTKAALKLLDDANAAIHYNREILQTALDHVRQGIAVYDKDMRLVCWNRQFGDILDLPPELTRIGVRLEEIVRHNAEQGALGPGPVEPLVRARLDHYVSDSEPFLKRFVDRGLVVEIRTNRMPDGGIVTTATDITPSVVAAEALERANATLEMRVRERTTELTRLNAELGRAKADADDANISKTRFLAAASHDILQPLNAARLYVTSLLERQGGGKDVQLIENVDASLDAVEEIFGALLDISRLDTGAMRAEFVSFRIDELLRQLEVEFAPLAREKGLELTFMPCSLAIRSDRRLLRRLLQNLVSNAIKYTPKGRVLVGCRRRGEKLRIDVFDTGLGIPGSKKRVIFREFLRLDEGAKVARGLGPWALDRRTHRTRARPQGEPALGAAPRLALLGGGAGVERCARAGAARGRGRRSRTTRRHRRAVHRQRAEGARRHGDAARRLGLPGAEGAGPRVRPRRRRRREGRAARAADRLSSRSRHRPRSHRRIAPPVRRRPAGDPDHRRPLARGARRGERARRAGAEQAAEARRLARADVAMARAAGGRGGIENGATLPQRRLDLRR